MKKSTFYAVIGLTILVASCKKEDKVPIDPPNNTEEQLTIALRIPEGEGTADYLIPVKSITNGIISANNKGIEQLGWRSYIEAGNSILSVGFGEDNRVIGYTYNENGDLNEKGSFAFEATLDLFGKTETKDELIGIELPRKGAIERTFHRIDSDGLGILEKKKSIIYQLDETIAWPTSLNVRGNQLYVPFYMLAKSGDFSTPSTDTAYVAIYSYPELELTTIIKDTRLGPLGIYGNSNGLIESESGDLYGYSAASNVCGFTTQEKPSGIIRIKKGSNSFDPNYFYNFEEDAGKKISWMHPIGGNKVIARVFTDPNSAAATWAAYSVTTPSQELVLIDLENKSFTNVQNVPVHGGQYDTPVFIEDGIAYMSITSTEGAAIYSIDLSSGKATKGAIIEGAEIQLITKF